MEFLYLVLNYLNEIVLGVLAFCVLSQLVYYVWFYLPLTWFKSKVDKKKDEPVSVIICARDEAENLEKYLPSVLEQDYDNFEVIVVNDCSSDDSDMILKRLSQKYKHLKLTEIKKDQKFSHGKKLALTVGIKAAQNEWLLLTDADCEPVSKNWIRTMQENFTEGTDLVLGYGGYFPKKGLLNKIIRIDALMAAVNYLGFAKAGFPYAGVGRNLAYRKSLFFANKGFASHISVLSGDDDLFVNEVAQKLNTKIEVRPDSFTRSEAKTKWTNWLHQKRRHTSTGKLYKFKHRFMLGHEISTRLFFYITAIYLAIQFEHVYLVFGLIAGRMLLNWITNIFLAKKFQEKGIFLTSVFQDLFSLIFSFFIILLNSFSRKKYQWK